MRQSMWDTDTTRNQEAWFGNGTWETEGSKDGKVDQKVLRAIKKILQLPHS